MIIWREIPCYSATSDTKITHLELRPLDSPCDAWLVDDIRFPGNPGDNGEKQFRIVAIRECVTHKMICARAFPEEDFACEAIADTLKDLADEVGWPKYICTESGSVFYRKVMALLNSEGKTFKPLELRFGPTTHSVEKFFNMLKAKLHETPYISNATNAQINFWLEDVQATFNNRQNA